MSDEVIKQEECKEDKSKGNLTDKFRENPWMLSTIVLSVLVIILLAGNLKQ